MDRWVGRVAMVTGASSGIGYAIARDLAKAGIKVVALARRKEILDDLASEVACEKGELHPVKCDLMKEEEILAAFEYANTKLGGVDILINNAAVVSFTTLLEGPTDDYKRVIDTNLLGLCICTREAYKSMQKKGVDDGHIVHINSIAGHYIPIVKNFSESIYACTKFGVTAATEVLRLELMVKKSRVKVTSISPGYVDTPIISKEANPEVMEVLSTVSALKVEDISNAVLYVLSTPPHVQVHELTIRPIGEPY